MRKITKAIIPVAGLGTRFLPATKAEPKEMLPIVDKPAVQYLVEEASATGITDIIFVTGRGKRTIEDHFDVAPGLERTLEEEGKTEAAKLVRDISNLARFVYVRQKYPRGDGDAILAAAHLIGDEPVAVLFGDCIYESTVPAIAQLLAAYEEYQTPILGLAEVPKKDVVHFGVIGGKKVGKRDWLIERFVEKPKVSEAPSCIVAPGKYLITPEVIRTLEELRTAGDFSGELRLADAFTAMAQRGEKLYGRLLEGEWLDCGSKIGFLKATVRFGLTHAETKAEFKKFLKSLAP
ncbi:MAG: Uncharacterized protein Greene041679_355 [Parcubacteria group bacterium Greene0416_79]|nr:MAG: Uncharacterized protein Greene041679_355 [Parcubacteria group bacterium Greene0416_79]